MQYEMAMTTSRTMATTTETGYSTALRKPMRKVTTTETRIPRQTETGCSTGNWTRTLMAKSMDWRTRTRTAKSMERDCLMVTTMAKRIRFSTGCWNAMRMVKGYWKLLMRVTPKGWSMVKRKAMMTPMPMETRMGTPKQTRTALRKQTAMGWLTVTPKSN